MSSCRPVDAALEASRGRGGAPLLRDQPSRLPDRCVNSPEVTSRPRGADTLGADEAGTLPRLRMFGDQRQPHRWEREGRIPTRLRLPRSRFSAWGPSWPARPLQATKSKVAHNIDVYQGAYNPIFLYYAKSGRWEFAGPHFRWVLKRNVRWRNDLPIFKTFSKCRMRLRNVVELGVFVRLAPPHPQLTHLRRTAVIEFFSSHG